MTMNQKATTQTRNRYQRISRFYNVMEIMPEKIYQAWRQQLWPMVTGTTVLEVGVGTGKNMPFYPPTASMTAIDLTPGMLAQAEAEAQQLGIAVELHLGDAQALPFADNVFAEAVATFVFCSVPDAVLGLNELARVVKPGGGCFVGTYAGEVGKCRHFYGHPQPPHRALNGSQHQPPYPAKCARQPT
jgi:ubiquinone/menaquinone biosynthesis C-methylase UbiE